MSDLAADPRSYTIYGEARAARGWRPGALSLSLLAALIVCAASGTVIIERIADLPDIDSLFAPQIVQAAAAVAPPERMTVLAAASQNDIDIAPTPPVRVEPYAPDEYAPDAPTVPAIYDDESVETPAPVMTRAEVAADAQLAQTLEASPSSPQADSPQADSSQAYSPPS